jgi:hypothetical protein
MLRGEFLKLKEMTNEQIEQGRKQGMVQGIALALSYSLRGNSERDIWKAAGLSIEECIDNRVDIFDMEKLIPEFAEIDDTEIVAGYYISNLPESDERRVRAETFISNMNQEMMSDLKGRKLHDQLAYRKQQYLDILKNN